MTKIIQTDNKILRKIAKEIPVSKIKSKAIQGLIEQMFLALSEEKDGVALAAPQIAKSLRVFVISPLAYDTAGYEGEKKLVFINPKIIKRSRDKKLMEEGCLSVRPFYGKVRRSSRATIEAYDENGVKFQINGAGLVAQIFQHETDHLDGVLFIDKAKDVIEMPESVFKKNGK